MNTSEEFPDIYMNFIERYLISLSCDDKDAMTVKTQKKLKSYKLLQS